MALLNGSPVTQVPPDTFSALAALARGVAPGGIRVPPIPLSQASAGGPLASSLFPSNAPTVFPIAPPPPAARTVGRVPAGKPMTVGFDARGNPILAPVASHPLGALSPAQGMPSMLAPGTAGSRVGAPPKQTPVQKAVPRQSAAKHVAPTNQPGNANGSGAVGAYPPNTTGYDPNNMFANVGTLQSYLPQAEQLAKFLIGMPSKPGQAEFGPLGMIDWYTGQGLGGINTLSNAINTSLAGMPAAVDAGYGAAENAQAAISDALQSNLSGQNPNGQVQSLLQAINAPQSQQQQAANGNQGAYGGGGNVLQAEGGLATSGLASSRAAQDAFANELPAMSQMQAQMAQSRFLQQQNQQRMSLLAGLPQQEYNIASGYLGNAIKMAQLQMMGNYYGARSNDYNTNAQVNLGKLNGTLPPTAAQTQAASDTIGKNVSAFLQKAGGQLKGVTYVLTKNGFVPATQANPNDIVKGPTGTVQKITNYQPVGGMNYKTIVQGVKRIGSPNPFKDAWSIVPRGQLGRPPLTPNERAALTNALGKSGAIAQKYKGLFYLNDRQVQALNRAKMGVETIPVKDNRSGKTVYVITGLGGN